MHELAKKMMQQQNQINIDCYDIAKENGLLSDVVLGPIYDGVPYGEAYLEISPRVLWILQEPYDNAAVKGNWSVPTTILQEDYGWGNKTHEAIAKVMYAFRNNLQYEEVDRRYSCSEDFSWDVMAMLKSTAWINVSKMPSPTGAQSSALRIKNAYLKYWKDIVRRQVEVVLQPDIVVIAGAQWEYVSWDLLPNGKERPDDPEKVERWHDGHGRQYLWTYHPAARKPRYYAAWVTELCKTRDEFERCHRANNMCRKQ